MNELKHYGVLGMRWGVRKNRSSDGFISKVSRKRKERKEKLENIISKQSKNGGLRVRSDLKRIKYRAKSAPMRYSSIAASIVTQQIISDLLSGRISRYSQMSKKELLNEVKKIAKSTAITGIINDKLADSAAKNYEKDGKLKKGVKKNTILTKQDVIETAIRTSVAMLPFYMGFRKLKRDRDRQKEKERFESWGERILSSKVPNIVWQADDFSMDIIDER